MGTRSTFFISLVVAATASVIAAGCSDGAGAKNNGANNGAGGLDLPRDYVRGDRATRLVLQLDSVEGISARQQSRDYVVDKLGAVLDKPDGIEWEEDETLAQSDDGTWTFDELRELADDSFSPTSDEGVVEIHVMYVDGVYENENVLGVAWSNRHLAMFAERLDATCERPLLGDQLCPVAESSVLLHEMGHVIGLVDNGVPMVEDHKDEEHGAHDESDECVMYWAYEGVGVLDVLAGRITGASPELDFGPNCRADLDAVE